MHPSEITGFYCVYGTETPCPDGSQTYHGSIPIPRVAGHGILTGNAYNADGSIRDWLRFVANGVVGRKAFIRVSAYSTDETYAHSFTFVMNGRVIGAISIPAVPNSSAQTVIRCFEADIDGVRFALRNTGTSPTPGQNAITVFGDGVIPPITCEICVVGAEVESITVEAMSPVVLVHGILSGSQAFDQFEPVLNEIGIPTRRVNLGNGRLEEVGGRLRQLAIQTATEFGTSRVHVVAHSKGGLWSRHMIRNLPPSLGVYSLTTLDTPHLGSALADDLAGLTQRLSPISSFARSGVDLTVANLRSFNAATPLAMSSTAAGFTNRVQYAALAADANVSGDLDTTTGYGIIQPDESALFQYPPIAADLYQFLQTVREIIVLRDAQGRVTRQSILHCPSPPGGCVYPLNDFVVTVPSSWCSEENTSCRSMILLPDASSPWKASHGGVLLAEVARYVRQTLGIAQEAGLSY